MFKVGDKVKITGGYSLNNRTGYVTSVEDTRGYMVGDSLNYANDDHHRDSVANTFHLFFFKDWLEPAKPDLKIGDRVRILTDGYKRTEGTLADIVPNSVYPYQVDVPNGGLWVFKEEELELIEQKQPKVIKTFNVAVEDGKLIISIDGEIQTYLIEKKTSWMDTISEYEDELREGEDTYYNSYEDEYDSYGDTY